MRKNEWKILENRRRIWCKNATNEAMMQKCNIKSNRKIKIKKKKWKREGENRGKSAGKGRKIRRFVGESHRRSRFIRKTEDWHVICKILKYQKKKRLSVYSI